ncbi:MAG: type II toxin-antitoxin system Phd/YefM family antitoxin [Lachnospiraceae bacterium]|nr:type II toxin-antitoxin system Phd/YefM family antitoxin [Lachnospiraceae bacterium]
MIIAKQMDVRSNIKKYFDMACEGDAVIVPRKDNKNVVIISETEYSRLNESKRLSSYSQLMKKKSHPDVPEASVRSDNMNKLKLFRDLKDNWNGNGAPAFPPAVIEKTEKLLLDLNIQPEIFPTALCSIQLEYNNSRRDHMEIEIGESEETEIFVVMYNGEEHFESIPCTGDALNERISEFYE